jgi:single-strand DNA-binding protein
LSLSKIVVSGKVIRNPEKRFTPNTNVAVTEFAIAVEPAFRPDQAGESTPVKILTWRDLAERCAQEIKKGDLVTVDGRLQINNYTTNDGQRRRDVEIEAVQVENLSTLVSKHAQSGHEHDEDAFDQPVEKTAGLSKVGAPAAAKNKAAAADDLDIFASEDEIPF